VLFLAANIVAGIQAHQARAAYQGHIQPFVKPFEELTRMRPDFTALVREFGREQYKDCKVLGTFDLQAHNWWVAFGPGYVFNPNSFRSTLPDGEIERRVLLLTHVMGLESRPLDEIVLWLGSNKYQANRIHSFAPLDQYAPAEADAIRNVSFIENWHLVLPTTERDRLLALRRSLASQPPEAAPRLDLIVMTNTSDQRQSAPDPKRWGCSFQNATYRVFVRAK
jgi:hypothetical protein